MTGIFITFEGIEGSGKSTQMQMVFDELHAHSSQVIATREPGGSAIGEAIRAILLNPDNEHISPLAELLLYNADRAEHVSGTIRPALAKGAIVLCDRFYDSTVAYQGAARSLSSRTLRTLHKIATDDLLPDYTVLFDLDVVVGKRRLLKRRGKVDRLEQESTAFHQRVREEYLRLAASEPGRFFVVDASPDIHTVHANVMKHITEIVRSRCGPI